jgi:hypothetical protein
LEISQRLPRDCNRPSQQFCQFITFIPQKHVANFPSLSERSELDVIAKGVPWRDGSKGHDVFRGYDKFSHPAQCCALPVQNAIFYSNVFDSEGTPNRKPKPHYVPHHNERDKQHKVDGIARKRPSEQRRNQDIREVHENSSECCEQHDVESSVIVPRNLYDKGIVVLMGNRNTLS